VGTNFRLQMAEQRLVFSISLLIFPVVLAFSALSVLELCVLV
jgi:hypothetical protein